MINVIPTANLADGADEAGVDAASLFSPFVVVGSTGDLFARSRASLRVQ